VHFNGGNTCEHSTCESEPLPTTGVYTLIVVDSGLTHTGPYSITLESIAESFDGASNGPPTPVCGAPTDGTRNITCGERVTGNISVTGDSDTYTFHAYAGESVAFVVEQLGGGSLLEPAAELFAPDGTWLMHLSGPPYPAPPLPSGPLPETGVYTIKVTDYNEGVILDGTGPYAVTIVTGNDEASNLSTNGGSVPGGRWRKSAMARLERDAAATSTFAFGWKNTLMMLTPGSERDSMCSMSLPSVKKRSKRVVMSRSISSGGIPE